MFLKQCIFWLLKYSEKLYIDLDFCFLNLDYLQYVIKGKIIGGFEPCINTHTKVAPFFR